MQPAELFQKVSPLLNLSESSLLTQCVESYAKSPFSSLSHLLYRIVNAVKHAFSYLRLAASDWQKSSKLLEAKLAILPHTYSKAGQLRSQAEEILKMLVRLGRLPKPAPKACVCIASAPKTAHPKPQPQPVAVFSKVSTCAGAKLSRQVGKSTASVAPLPVHMSSPILTPTSVPAAMWVGGPAPAIKAAPRPQSTFSITITPPSASALPLTAPPTPVMAFAMPNFRIRLPRILTSIPPIVTDGDSSPSSSPVMSYLSPVTSPILSPLAATELALLAQPPLHGIQMKLLNFQTDARGEAYGDTSWLNSGVMFMATSTYYDDLLNLTNVPEKLVELHRSLRMVIHTLRTASSKSIMDLSIYAPLVEAYRACRPAIRHQLDPVNDFLRFLSAAFKYPSKIALKAEFQIREKEAKEGRGGTRFVKTALEYNGGNKNFEEKDAFEVMLDVVIPVEDLSKKKAINLMHEISRPAAANVMESNRSFWFEDAPHVETKKFRKPLCLPDRLVIDVMRTGEVGGRSRSESRRPIQFDDKGEIVLYEFGIASLDNLVLVPKVRCVYRVDAAISQVFGALGEERGKQAHYVCTQVNDAGAVVRHDDSSSEASIQVGAWAELQQASLFRLKLVSKIPVEDPFTCEAMRKLDMAAYLA